MPVRGPRLKIVRRLGTQLPGLTRKSGDRRPQPPGAHGAGATRRRKGAYRLRLEEKQKVRFNYGLTEGQMLRYMERAASEPGKTGENLLALLERRLDNVVFRLGFTPTIPAARQLVVHGHVRVGGRTVDRPAYSVCVGDVVSLSAGANERADVLASVTRGVRLPSYLARDGAECVGRVVGLPARSDASVPVQEAMIVEFYAR